MEIEKTRRKLITISVPVYNEEDNIPTLMKRLRAFSASQPDYDFEFLFTDNASEDRTYDCLALEAKADPRVRVVRFSRNFGYQRSILTNFLMARGDAAVQVDADLQDPPEMIVQFIDYWVQGYKVVYGIRRRREEAGRIRVFEYDRAPPTAGTTKFNFLRLVRLGIDGIVSQSTAPLHYITIFGFMLFGLSGLASVAYLIYWALNWEHIAAGFTTIVLLQLVTIGLNAVFLGVLGEYLARVTENVRGHPFVVVDRIIDRGVEKVSDRVFEIGEKAE